jgi:hypothetical protein
LARQGDTTGENYPSRVALLNAYCDAYEAARCINEGRAPRFSPDT